MSGINQYAIIGYKGMKTVGSYRLHNVSTTTLHNTPKKIIKYYSNLQKIGDAYLQCANNHYAKFEYKGMKTTGATDYTNQTPPKHFRWKKCLKLNTSQKMKKQCIYQMYTK